MMVKEKFIVFFLLTSCLFVHAQDSILKNRVYLDAKLFDESSVGFERKVSNRVSLSAEIGYNWGGMKDVYTDMGILFYPKFAFMQLADYGPVVAFSINIYPDPDQYHVWSLDYFYRDLYSDDLIYDPGYYAGSNTSDYAEFDMFSKEHGLLVTYSLPQDKPLMFYIGVGCQRSHRKKHYSFRGIYSDRGRISRNETSEEVVYSPIIRLGCEIKIANF